MPDSYWEFLKNTSPWIKRPEALPPAPEFGALPSGAEQSALPGGGGQRALPPGPEFIEGEASVRPGQQAIGQGEQGLVRSAEDIAAGRPHALTAGRSAVEAGSEVASRGRGLGRYALPAAGAAAAYGLYKLLSRQPRTHEMPSEVEKANMANLYAKFNKEPEAEGVPLPRQGYLGKAGEFVFTNRPGQIESGTYDVNAPDAAAASLRARGGRYGGAASYMNDLESALGARLRTAEQLAQNEPGSIDEIFRETVEVPQAEVGGKMAGTLERLGAIDAAETQRRERGALGAMLSKVLGIDVSGIGDEGMKTLQSVLNLQRQGRADERSQQLAESLMTQRRGAEMAPNRMKEGARKILNAHGYDVIERGGQPMVVDSSGRPVPNSAKLYAGAQEAYKRQLGGK